MSQNQQMSQRPRPGLLLSPAGLVGFSAGRRLQKLSSAPRALARLQLLYHMCVRTVVN